MSYLLRCALSPLPLPPCALRDDNLSSLDLHSSGLNKACAHSFGNKPWESLARKLKEDGYPTVATGACAAFDARLERHTLAPGRAYVRRFGPGRFESEYLDRLQSKVSTLDEQIDELEKEIMYETACALKRSEDKVNLALLQIQVAGIAIERAVRFPPVPP